MYIATFENGYYVGIYDDRCYRSIDDISVKATKTLTGRKRGKLYDGRPLKGFKEIIILEEFESKREAEAARDFHKVMVGIKHFK